ncbi:MAG TPA: AMP-binding protein [Burkholderiales bacterium]|nr:AMP-binding protein [Burkholderiales bacterium]
MVFFPVIRHSDADAVFAYCKGHPVTAGQFLHDVSQLAALLPDSQYILNLCSDRYRFAVGFCAALLRQQISLLPPNHTPELIGQLENRYPDLYCLTDASVNHPTLKTVFYPQSLGVGRRSFPAPVISAAQTAALVFTSGSTGQPAPHRKSWGSVVKSALAEFNRLGLNAYPGMAIVGTVPPQHMYGLESTVLMFMQGGQAFSAERPFYPADIRAALEALPRPRGLVTTPVHLRALLAELEETPPVDFLLCATAPLSPQLAVEAEKRFAAPLYEIYGCTEAGQVATRRPVKTPEWRVFQDLALRQDDKGVWVGGGHVEAETLLSDVIELRDQETFLLHGRTADLVNIAGKRTSLANLNYHLNSIEGVRDGVFVMPEDESETVTRLMAFVVAPELTSDSLMSALRLRIDAAFLPRPLYFVESLPRNTTGKLTRDALNKLIGAL